MMPKVKSFTPAWLAHGSPGNALFTPSPERPTTSSPYTTRKKVQNGPRRTIARRGTEIFVANGREIRWGDLAYLKEMYTEKQTRASRSSPQIKREDCLLSAENAPDVEGVRAEGYRTIKTPAADDIRQLIISPNDDYLAILTAHTIHICAIPDPSHLTADDTSPLRPKIWTLGPTIHVTSRSPIASALWHPFGARGSCLVTVSVDSIVRVWELSPSDRWSFDQPSLDIDMRKLADGTTLDQNFSSSASATNAAFSPDSFEMEVASACFGARSTGGWSPFTLWIAMRDGDVYALCPLLPTRWAPPPALIASLSVSIVAKVAAMEDDASLSNQDRLLAQQQLAWMGDIDAQEPQIIDVPLGETPVEVYARPSKPGAYPRLQGPFSLEGSLENEDDIDTELTDILVIGPRVESDELILGEDAEFELDGADKEGLSLSLICLLSTGGQVKVCLDLDGVEARWLPPRGKSAVGRLDAGASPPSLLIYQAMDSMNPIESRSDAWPVFSADLTSRYSFYVTHHAGITCFSLSPWVFRLEGEIQDPGAGSEFRLGLLVSNHNSLRDRLYSRPSASVVVPLAACTAFCDPDVGYGVISATPYEPIVLFFEIPEDDYPLVVKELPAPGEQESDIAQPLYSYEPRPLFTPSYMFEQNSLLPSMRDRLLTSKYRVNMGQEIRLSPMTLRVLTEVHKVMSEETHRLGLAASELFLKCDRIPAEMLEHLRKAAETKAKIDKIVGGRDGSDNERIEQRIAQAQDRQQRLAHRLETLRKTASQSARREPSQKEMAFFEEVRGLATSVLGPPPSSKAPSGGRNKASWQRLQDVQRLAGELQSEANQLAKRTETKDDEGGGRRRAATPDLRIPGDVRKSRLHQVRSLLDRESALVEAVSARLERLQMNVSIG